MTKKLIIFTVALGLALTAVVAGNVQATSSYEGQIVKMEGLDTLYYVAADGKRYVFPNEKTYKSWFFNFDDVATLSAEEIQAIPLGGNVRYRPGVVMVKITTDPKVYAVTENGRLRWVKTEQLAKKFYGDNWNLLIDDVPDSFFTNYTIGEDIDEDGDYDPDTEISETATIDGNRGQGKKLGHAKRANSGKCRAIPATPAVPAHKSDTGEMIPAVPAVPASRICKVQTEAESEAESEELFELTISDLEVTAGTSSATVAWATNASSTSAVEYALESLTTSADIMSTSSIEMVFEHSLTLENLIASTTYYYVVTSVDEDANEAISAEDKFTTLKE